MRQRHSGRLALGANRDPLPIALVLVATKDRSAARVVNVLVGALVAQESDPAADGRPRVAEPCRPPVRAHANAVGRDLVLQLEVGAARTHCELHLHRSRRGPRARDLRRLRRLRVPAGVAPGSHVLLQVGPVVVVRRRPPEVRLQRRREQLLALLRQALQEAAGLGDARDDGACCDSDVRVVLGHDRRQRLAGRRREGGRARVQRELLPGLLMAGRHESTVGLLPLCRHHEVVFVRHRGFDAQAFPGLRRQLHLQHAGARGRRLHADELAALDVDAIRREAPLELQVIQRQEVVQVLHFDLALAQVLCLEEDGLLALLRFVEVRVRAAVRLHEAVDAEVVVGRGVGPAVVPAVGPELFSVHLLLDALVHPVPDEAALQDSILVDHVPVDVKATHGVAHGMRVLHHD
mmetsp:Transcript_74793/g.193040  ORF Transcript_74793/g.193040 Transcript_74793/m.193040 type:complete len:406 (+) Transcript_74793:1191-2408(+)